MDWNSKEARREYMREYHRKWRRKHTGHPANTDSSIRKICTKCKIEKPATLKFFEKHKTARLGLASQCKKCRSLKSAQWNANHREHVTSRQRQWREKNREHCQYRERVRSLKKYGITPEKYDAIFNAQGGVCAICSRPPEDDKKRRLAVDHDHASGRNRGLLCICCNRSLQRIENDPSWGTKALNYLARYIEQTVKV